MNSARNIALFESNKRLVQLSSFLYSLLRSSQRSFRQWHGIQGEPLITNLYKNVLFQIERVIYYYEITFTDGYSSINLTLGNYLIWIPSYWLETHLVPVNQYVSLWMNYQVRCCPKWVLRIVSAEINALNITCWWCDCIASIPDWRFHKHWQIAVL